MPDQRVSYRAPVTPPVTTLLFVIMILAGLGGLGASLVKHGP